MIIIYKELKIEFYPLNNQGLTEKSSTVNLPFVNVDSSGVYVPTVIRTQLILAWRKTCILPWIAHQKQAFTSH